MSIAADVATCVVAFGANVAAIAGRGPSNAVSGDENLGLGPSLLENSESELDSENFGSESD